MRTHALIACILICENHCEKACKMHKPGLKAATNIISIYKQSTPRRPINKHAGIIVKFRRKREEKERGEKSHYPTRK